VLTNHRESVREMDAYSSEANGDLDPVGILPAIFFKAWHRARNEDDLEEEDRLDVNGWPLRKMQPFQIRMRDEDRRRPSRRRHGIAVPHWVYVAKPEAAEQDRPRQNAQRRPRSSPERDKARDAVIARYGKIPSDAEATTQTIYKEINRGRAEADIISKGTIEWATGRRR
jgi:hypothetical protein